eukprot:TRINITY_DN9079_c0_g2_i1.p1 TRINITY_DN9079_c0_g2~~TRINITY_DN9079_c0_g2_i1.p1  ORF type:complete len:668 (+),score=150.36 TRINITY_DN9079_c0_g2_i1:127-2130(+)
MSGRHRAESDKRQLLNEPTIERMSRHSDGAITPASSMGAADSGRDPFLRSQSRSLPGDHRKDSPIQVLTLQPDQILRHCCRRFAYSLITGAARILPAVIIYGGTAGLLVCAIYSYRWGVLLSLTLFTFYMFLMSVNFMFFSAVGVVKVWQQSNERWYELFMESREQLKLQKDSGRTVCSKGDHYALEDKDATQLDWDDVLHIVMIPSYKTPEDVLEETISSMAKFSGAKTNMGIVVAFEMREQEAAEKGARIRQALEDKFLFIMQTFHPPNLPNHVPGKSSNECWAFQQLQRELQEKHDIAPFDPRVVITVVDDDSEVHQNYFEALTYHFLTEAEQRRYLSTWQPPICHFKNYIRQPVVVRMSSLFATLSELSCLANPVDCHVNYSSYSLSYVLASAVGGWDPDYLAEDWHMYAKCNVKTGGRVRCIPIFLPLLNYTPEEDTYVGTMISRWTQAKRHALGVSELVYVISTTALGLFELSSFRERFLYLWRLSPVIGKFAGVHYINGMSVVLNCLSQIVIHIYMWRSWCYMSTLDDPTGSCRIVMSSATQSGIAQEQIVLNSWMVFLQHRFGAGMCIAVLIAGGIGAMYFELVKDRIEGDVRGTWYCSHWSIHWLYLEVGTVLFSMISALIYGAAPTWIAVFRIIREAQFTHVVAGMVGRADDGDDDV